MQLFQKRYQLHWFWMVLLSGALLTVSWPVNGLTPLLFIAWVPLLRAAEKAPGGYGFFFSLWGAFLLWNTGTTWWIWNSTGPGAAGAIIANSLIMCFPVMAYRFTRKHLALAPALVAFAAYWILYEYLHHNWELSWPWLTLGNALADRPEWIQWYRYTGTTGGSIWILTVNLLFYLAWKKHEQQHPRRKWYMVTAMALCTLPVIWGMVSYPDPVRRDFRLPNVVVVQPNVEPYREKFSTDPAILTRRLIDASAALIDSNTRLVVWPETAIPAQAWEHQLDQIPVFEMVDRFLQAHPQVMLVTGIDSYIFWGDRNPGGMSIRQMDNGMYYEAFNTAMGKAAGNGTQLYHKSKLVPGVESLPSWLGFMSSVFDDFGGISGSLGRSQKAAVFSVKGNPFVAAPVICYESIYSDYLTSYIRAGANIITIITNDGWWGETPGHKQHMAYARLRAIETGCWVARSANTGISCFIDPAGHLYEQQGWNVRSAVKMPVPPVNTPSFYAKTGDWLSLPAGITGILIFISSIYLKWKQRKP